MNFIENETPQKLRGGYYTAPDIAAFLARWVLDSNPTSILEPSSGDGAFIKAIAQVGTGHLQRFVACELDAGEAAKSDAAAKALAPAVTTDVLVGDFLTWALDRLDGPALFDGVIGNPPFIRYQYLDSRLQERAERLIRRAGLRFTKHTNAWVPFVIASIGLLRSGGRLGMVVPAELLHVIHAQSARQFLIDQCARILVLDPEEIWFEETLQGVVLLLVEKRNDSQPATQPGKVTIHPVRGRDFLGRNPRDLFAEAAFTDGADLPGKWMLALLSKGDRDLLRGLTENPSVGRFSDVAKACVGIVTGANKFFLVPDRTVDEYSLDEFALPMFGRSEHVPGVIYDEAVHASNRKAGLPANFIWFDGTSRDELPAGALRYVEKGEAEGLHRRYKCRIREPWFTVPSVFTAPVGMLKRCHNYPRLVLNDIGAYTTDTAYRIVPRSMGSDQLAYAFVNSLTALTAELEGRHYGGGVLELVPSEINKLLVPRSVNGGHRLEELDRACREGWSPEAVFDLQDPAVLGPLGLGREEMDVLAHAWWTLRNRRHRGSSRSENTSRSAGTQRQATDAGSHPDLFPPSAT